LGITASIDHSQMKTDDRSRERASFSSGRARAMVAVRSLDEGVDVPEAEIAIIASGSRSKRQRIQRMGRVLRHLEDKHALCISILVRGTVEESVTGAKDADLVGAGRVRHHRFGKNPPNIILEPDLPSGYKAVALGRSTEVDRLTMRYLHRPHLLSRER
jgi:superfamily II DNA or RNA helicase